MGDWNTLHLFDSKRFHKEIAPELKDGGQIIDSYIKSKLYWYITRIDQIEIETINKVKSFFQNFDISFSYHNELYEIENSKKKAIDINQDIENFQRRYSDEIFFYTSVLPLIIFSECAQFNPHLILGRKIFQNNISSKKGSIAEKYCNKITAIRIGEIGYSDAGYIINWLTFEEVKLLWLDIENVHLSQNRSIQYLNDFKKFVKIAVDNELGFLSISNVREAVFKLIEKPKLNIEINLKEMNFVNVIEYK